VALKRSEKHLTNASYENKIHKREIEHFLKQFQRKLKEGN
jgi:hypothetical protein